MDSETLSGTALRRDPALIAATVYKRSWSPEAAQFPQQLQWQAREGHSAMRFMECTAADGVVVASPPRAELSLAEIKISQAPG